MNQTPSTVQDFLRLKQEREKTFLVTLPSGLIIRMRKPGIANLILGGYIPDDILNFAIGATGRQINIQELAKRNLLEKFIKTAKKIAIMAVVEPKMKEGETDDTAIGVDDLEVADIFAIFGNLEREQQTEDGSRTGINKEEVKEFLKKKKAI